LKKIWKFPLKLTDEQEVNLPAGAEILAMQMQGEVLCMWVLVDEQVEKTKNLKTIRIIGTGYPDDVSKSEYFTTFQIPKIGIVLHVFVKE